MSELEREVYERLADHLDRLPAGFPRTPSGVEIRILQKLFTPEEAVIAQGLTMKPEPPQTIARRLGRDSAEMAHRLYEMSKKGLIFRVRKGDQLLYMAAQFVIGIWEYHVNSLDEELIRDMNEYIPYFFRAHSGVTPQLRTIPLPKSLTPEQTVVPYAEAHRIIQSQERIVVAPCICRKEHQMEGKGCDRPLETCLVFGTGAQYYEENGLGRPITKDEALEILQRAEEAGLVLQPSNAQRVVNICMCCGCCCQILKNLRKLPKPADAAASHFYASVDPEACIGCGTCEERCQMDAVSMESETAVVNLDRCIGCGLCVTTCPEEAMRLQEKAPGERPPVPSNLMETYMRIAKERASRQL